jgi:hypothetical protein
MYSVHTMPSWKNVALLGGGSVVFFWQLRHPIIRFAWPVANALFGFVLGLCLPWLTAVATFCIGRWWSKAIALIAVIPLVLYSAVFLLGWAMTGLDYRNGRDLTFDRFAETYWKGSEVRFYRTDGGATTHFGVVVRQERSLFPGVLLVRQLDDFYPCFSLDAASTDTGITVRDGRSECRDLPEQRREYRLKPFLYF